MPRDTFLAKVRAATMAGRKHRVAVEELPDRTGYVGTANDLVESFAHEMIAVGGTAYIVDDVAAAAEKLGQILDELNPTNAITWEHDLLSRVDLADVLRKRNVRHFSHQSLVALPVEDQRKIVLECDMGISSVDWGVAETGTMIVKSRPGHERVISLVPPVHLAVIHRTQIVPDLFDVFDELPKSAPEGLPSNLAFITGPSKTGDIELQLTTGIHGPGTWIAVVIRK